MDQYQENSVRLFTDIAENISNKELLSGRYEEHSIKVPMIWKDIQAKLCLQKQSKFLDLGCGCGSLTDLVLKASSDLDCDLCLLIFQQLQKN
jgi:2-polyprenyl-3-methyl-5-hydroxy-6-metoxy-1,4-benzoquinol methylase